MKRFMLDIETNGLDPFTQDILQIGILEVNERGDYYEPGKAFSRTLYSTQKPGNAFCAETHKDLYPICRRTPITEPLEVRAEIRRFFSQCGAEGPVHLMGQNLMSLDVPFMRAKNYFLELDTHYRVFELMPIASVAAKLLNTDVATVYRMAGDNQLKSLNGMIRLIRRTQSQAV